jgi:Family of unknown function (DUF695)
MPWSHRQIEIEKRPAQVLIDDRFRATASIRELPRLAWFGVFCRQVPSGSFWHPDETPSLDAIERDLIQLCDQYGRGWAVYVMRIDTPGIREYYIYCGNSSSLAHVLPSLQASHADYRIEFEESEDDAWNHYKTFLP